VNNSVVMGGCVGVGESVGVGARVGDGVELDSGAFTVGDDEGVWVIARGSCVDSKSSTMACVSLGIGWGWHPLKSTTLRRANRLRLSFMNR
jgi:hypothetical protein